MSESMGAALDPAGPGMQPQHAGGPDLGEALDAHDRAGDEAHMMQQTEAARGKADEEEQFVVFRLADEEYGVPIESVQEIVRIPDQLTRVPKVPRFIEGVANLRGTVLPFVDQRRRFLLPETERNDRQRIMVFTIDGVRTGFIVDSVSEVLKIPRSVISPAPELASSETSAISRVANIADQKRMILMPDVGKLLDKKEVAELKEAN
jgi:purine-binding chemotaxis protein CheW